MVCTTTYMPENADASLLVLGKPLERLAVVMIYVLFVTPQRTTLLTA